MRNLLLGYYSIYFEFNIISSQRFYKVCNRHTLQLSLLKLFSCSVLLTGSFEGTTVDGMVPHPDIEHENKNLFGDHGNMVW